MSVLLTRKLISLYLTSTYFPSAKLYLLEIGFKYIKSLGHVSVHSWKLSTQIFPSTETPQLTLKSSSRSFFTISGVVVIKTSCARFICVSHNILINSFNVIQCIEKVTYKIVMTFLGSLKCSESFHDI